MRTSRWLATLLAATLAACSSGTGSGEDPTAWPDAGSTAEGDGGSAFAVEVLDPQAAGEYPLSVAVSGDRIGVAYFVKDPANANKRILRYVERGGQPETVARMDLQYGVSLGFDAAGTPYVAYLGGASNEGFFWLQSDLVVARRTGGTWTEEVVVRGSIEATCPAPCNNLDGDVVGLWPTLAIDGAGKLFVAYRDGHYGQNPTDWEKSDLEVAEGGTGAWTRTVAVKGGNTTAGHGGMSSIALANGAPALSWSVQPGGHMDTPRGVWFARRDAAGAWSAPKELQVNGRSVGNTVSGPSLAWREGSGYGIAVEDRVLGIMSYLASPDGATWRAADPVHGSGTGGWYPSLAFAPTGEPAIAYYFCSKRTGLDLCPASEDQLLLAVRNAATGNWDKQPVDPEGGVWSRLAYQGERAVVAYRNVGSTELKLAVQR